MLGVEPGERPEGAVRREAAIRHEHVDVWVEVSVGGKWGGTNLKAVFHDFAANEGGDAYGTEVDLLASRTFECGVVGGLKLASYSADEFSEDTTKAWFWLGYSF